MTPPPLSEELWTLSDGPASEWRGVLGLRVRSSLERLKAVRALLRRGAPASLRPYRLPEALSEFLAAPAAARDALALFPGMDCWLSISDTFLKGSRPAREWEVHFPFFKCFEAALAAATGRSRRLAVRLDPEGRFHVTGTPEYFEFGRGAAGKPAEVRVEGGKVRAALDGRPGRRRAKPLITPTLWVETRDPLILQPMQVQPPCGPDDALEARYARVLARAMEGIRRLDAPLHAQMGGFLRVLVPLLNPKDYGSVSSSYQNLRGAFGLSHTEDVLLQEETLVHEFCHQKLNLVSEVDPLLEPGQSGQVFYSPLRPDPRRLRGLFLGAHAFLNVNRYLLRALARRRLSAAERDSARRNVVKRLFHVEDMLRTVCGYADLTGFGRRCALLMWREHMLHHHAVLSFPKGALAEAAAEHAADRGRNALYFTGFSRRAQGAAAASARIRKVRPPQAGRPRSRAPFREGLMGDKSLDRTLLQAHALHPFREAVLDSGGARFTFERPVPWPLFLRLDLARPFEPRAAELGSRLDGPGVVSVALRADGAIEVDFA